MKKLKIGDLSIIIAIIALSVFVAFFNIKQGNTVVIEADGEVIKTLDLNTDTEFVFEDAYKNFITVKNGQVSVTESTCPDKSCVLSGKINSNNRIICCLPNKLIIRVESSDKKVDVISG